MKKPFYIDKVANYRVHYPFAIAKKSRLSRSVFRLLDLKNYNNPEYEITSENISDRCKAILRLLETKSVTKFINQALRDLDNMGNSFDN